MKRQAGFTLIELIVVIVILGILAAVAMPKYAGIQSGARAAVLQGGRGAVAGAMAITYGTQQGLGLGSNVDVVLDGVSISMVGGYPWANIGSSGIVGAAGLSAEYSAVITTPAPGPAAGLSQVVDIRVASAFNPATCAFSYIAANTGALGISAIPARVTPAITSGC